MAVDACQISSQKKVRCGGYKNNQNVSNSLYCCVSFVSPPCAPHLSLLHSLLKDKRFRDLDLVFFSMASKVVLIIIFVFDLIAFGLAVAAEQRRSTATTKEDPDQNYRFCVYDSDISTGLGVGAFLFLMASQVLIMVASKCFCCGRGLRPGGARAWGVILFIACWLTFLIAESCLLAGSVRNAYHTKYALLVSDPPSCQTLRKGVFGAGAAFIFFTCILSEFYYVSYSKADADTGVRPPYGRETGVGMGTY